MHDIQNKVGDALLKSLVQLKEQKGNVSLGDVGGIFMQMASSLHPTATEADQFMHQEIARLAQYIATAKKEIFVISSNDKSEAVITDASQHLDEVIKATEVASHNIMDAADAIQGAAAGLGGEKEKQIMDATNRIYEACNFQDLNGQRINKVIKLLNTIEEGVDKLNKLFNSSAEHIEAPKTDKPLSDAELLNGPQHSGLAPSQEQVDALFASLGEKK